MTNKELLDPLFNDLKCYEDTPEKWNSVRNHLLKIIEDKNLMNEAKNMDKNVKILFDLFKNSESEVLNKLKHLILGNSEFLDFVYAIRQIIDPPSHQSILG